MVYIGKRIRDIRKRKGLTQADLGEASGLSTMSIRRYESGERIIPEAALDRIANALGLKMIDLLLPDTVSDSIRLGYENGYVAYAGGKEAFTVFVPEWSDTENEILNAIVNFMEELNMDGKLKAVERIEEMTHLKKYQRIDAQEAQEQPAPAQPSTDTPNEEKPPEGHPGPKDGK